MNWCYFFLPSLWLFFYYMLIAKKKLWIMRWWCIL